MCVSTEPEAKGLKLLSQFSDLPAGCHSDFFTSYHCYRFSFSKPVDLLIVWIEMYKAFNHVVWLQTDVQFCTHTHYNLFFDFLLANQNTTNGFLVSFGWLVVRLYIFF